MVCIVLMIVSYYWTFKEFKHPAEPEQDSEDLESLEIGIKENHKKLGTHSIYFYRLYLVLLMFHKVSHEIFDNKKDN